jgi:predicted DCC family thiol-disulfide oxidoreductase YuxK
MDNEKLNTNPIQPTILYDGVCNFCIAVIDFVKRKDKKNIFLSMPIQSQEARAILRSHNEKFISLQTVYFIEDGKVYKKSKAVFKILRHLSFPWKIFSWFRVFPVFFTDAVYNVVARYRYKVFGKREE